MTERSGENQQGLRQAIDVKQQVDSELKAASEEIKKIFVDSGLVVYIPNFVADAQQGGNRLLGFGVRDPADYTADYEVDVWEGKCIFFKSIWPKMNREFEQKLRRMLAEKGYTNIRFALYTH